MRVTSLILEDFRCYRSLRIEPGAGLNICVGRNAQGKSSLMESLYVLATSKSTRAARDTELIRFQQPYSRVRAAVERERSGNVEIDLTLSQTEKKQMRLNGVRHPRLAEVIGQLNCVLFDSGDLEIIRGEPSVRRRFLDLEIAQTSPRYVYALAAFRKSLEQRNRLLKDVRDGRAGAAAHGTLAAWDQQIAQHGARLIERRILFIERLAVIAEEVHQALSDRRDHLRVAYVPSFCVDAGSDAEAIRNRYLEELQGASREEMVRGLTLYGPHRDDVLFAVNGQDCRAFGSQGQQRTVALSLKLAERRLIEELVGEPPLLLLDDVLSDLDDTRRRHLFDLTAAAGSQTLLSCTNLRPFSKGVLENAVVFAVDAGEVTRQ
jgi:DNA replication and repair protein RecF